MPGARDGGAEAAARYRQYEYKAVRDDDDARATTDRRDARAVRRDDRGRGDRGRRRRANECATKSTSPDADAAMKRAVTEANARDVNAARRASAD